MFNLYLRKGLTVPQAQLKALKQCAYIISADKDSAYKLMLEFSTTRTAHSRAIKAGARQSYEDFKASVQKGCKVVSNSRSKTMEMLVIFLNELPLQVQPQVQVL
jgi:hypothetical protein